MMKAISKPMLSSPMARPKDSDEEEVMEEQDSRYVQWNLNGDKWVPLEKLNLKKEIKPGYYHPKASPQGIWLEKLDVRLDGLVNFENGVAAQVVDQIDRFWESESKFRQINKNIKVLYKRGILLYGPPGCGKSSMLSVVMRDIIDDGGVALVYAGTELTTLFIKIIRQIQPNMKVLVIIEDLDGIVRHGEEDVLNMLDGVDTVLDSVIFLATTNYYNNLSRRMLRPSRFDLKIKMDYPAASLRKKYFSDLLKSYPGKANINLLQTVKDTHGFSFADLKELFISAVVFEYDYTECLNSLKASLYTEDEDSSSKSDYAVNQMRQMAQVLQKMVKK